MKIQSSPAIAPVPPPAAIRKACWTCKHGDKSLSYPICKGCGKPGDKYSRWEAK